MAAEWEPGRLRVMLLASGIPIKTILINQSLKYASNLKPWYSLSKSAGHHPVTSEGWGSCAHSLSLHYVRQGHVKASHPASRTWNEFDHWKSLFTLSQIVTLGKKMLSSCTEGSWATVSLLLAACSCMCWEFVLWALHTSNAPFSIVRCQLPSFNYIFTGILVYYQVTVGSYLATFPGTCCQNDKCLFIENWAKWCNTNINIIICLNVPLLFRAPLVAHRNTNVYTSSTLNNVLTIPS